MRHFSAAEWLELARDSTLLEQRSLMERHLADGCDKCRKLSAMWSEVVEISRREPSYTPPMDAVHSAKAAFVSERSWKWLPKIAQVAQLIFDSFRQPAPAAMRGAAATCRQLLQEAKPFVIDLRVEYEPARKIVRLTGQVLNSNEPDKEVSDVEAFLLKGEDLLSRTRANASGEFDLDFQEQEDLHLFIDIRGRKVIEIQLPTSLAEPSGMVGETKYD